MKACKEVGERRGKEERMEEATMAHFFVWHVFTHTHTPQNVHKNT
jgi:hypothetical protein